MGKRILVAALRDADAAVISALLRQGGYLPELVPTGREGAERLSALGLLALLREKDAAPETKLIAGPFLYDPRTLRLYKNGREIPLTGTEHRMMKLFLEEPGRVFPRELLYDLVWGSSVTDDNAVMVYINRLRRKIEDDPAAPRYIRNLRGIGYCFTPQQGS